MFEIEQYWKKFSSCMCTWHIPLSLQKFVLSANPTSHFCLINEYAFTLSAGCFKILQTEDIPQSSDIMGLNTTQVELACAEFLKGNVIPRRKSNKLRTMNMRKIVANDDITYNHQL